MAKVNFIHICEKAFNGISGNLNIIEMFDKVITPSIPAVQPFFSLVAEIEGNEEKSVKVKMINVSSGSEIIVTEPIPVTNRKTFIIQNFAMIQFDQYSDYRFELYCNDELVGSTKLSVINNESN